MFLFNINWKILSVSVQIHINIVIICTLFYKMCKFILDNKLIYFGQGAKANIYLSFVLMV